MAVKAITKIKAALKWTIIDTANIRGEVSGHQTGLKMGFGGSQGSWRREPRRRGPEGPWGRPPLSGEIGQQGERMLRWKRLRRRKGPLAGPALGRRQKALEPGAGDPRVPWGEHVCAPESSERLF